MGDVDLAYCRWQVSGNSKTKQAGVDQQETDFLFVILTVPKQRLHFGNGGRVGAKGATLSQYVAQQIVSRKPDPCEKDPRGAILRHAKDAEENPYWIDTAYTKTQPVPVFRQSEEDKKKEEDDDGPLWKKKKMG